MLYLHAQRKLGVQEKISICVKRITRISVTQSVVPMPRQHGSRSRIVFLSDHGQGDDPCGQATKGVWGMPWRQEAMKGVEDCDKPGGLVKRELIPGSLNHLTLNP